MLPRSHHRLRLVLVLVALAGVAVARVSGGKEEDAACDAANRPDEALLRPDRLTVLLSGYSERRLPLLRAIAGAYAAHPLVLAVVVLWCNPSTPDRLLLRGGFPPRVTLRRAASASLNSRFLPDPSIRTAAVAVVDDDVLPDAAALSFAFAAWQAARPGSLVGFFPRSHHLDLARGRWMYTAAQPGRYSMVLTKFMILGANLLYKYSCSPELVAARAVVDRERNCEDILMNFVAAEETGEGPVLVEAGSVRDWGDPRNDANAGAGEGGAMKDVGLSSRGGTGHWEKRGECITAFHRLLGRMPLRYSYGKVVEAAVGEQGLCSKGGRLVRCDQE
ncbi:glycosyltransferase family protein 64 C3-like [Phragmites australis]|uniref:glycosyltransferase family protein 64 C3-like n=1 Tax=Phragmites australis TaxID=29695 RepID=UPI002D78F3F7|nr:glycosyltransferase family protein 64 C3-like [Phragmites australis]